MSLEVPILYSIVLYKLRMPPGQYPSAPLSNTDFDINTYMGIPDFLTLGSFDCISNRFEPFPVCLGP